MNLPLALAGALPALAAMWYVDRLDAKRPEPRWRLRKLAIAGGVAVIPCGVLELLLKSQVKLPPLPSAFFEAFVVAAAIEELGKLLCVYLFVWRRPELDERMDGIVYATRAALGFALVENILYLSSADGTGSYVSMYLGRALLAVPGHAIWAGLMGYLWARRRFDNVGPGLLGGYAVAVLLHGAYDAALFSLPEMVRLTGTPLVALPLLAVPLLVVGWGAVVLRQKARLAVALDDEAHRRAAAIVPIVG
jgi:RsiW-degrading membrane proteinase PrsW (M82 family)